MTVKRAGPGRNVNKALKSREPLWMPITSASLVSAAMTPHTEAPATRLGRLQHYLQEDPGNPVLLAECFDLALSCGERQRAEAILLAASEQGFDEPEWEFRRAQLCTSRRDLVGAATSLENLLSRGATQPAVVHDLAYVRLLQRDFAGCRALLAPWMEHASPDASQKLPADVEEAVQVLWLRAMHHLQHLEEAMAWARRQHEGGALHAAAKGVASLVALDLGDFGTARSFADAALYAGSYLPEAMVARGYVALAEGDMALARRLLERSIERNPQDGRAWSALGFLTLQLRELPLAQRQLERAVQLMPDHVGTWHALGWAALLQGSHAAALAAFRSALALDRNFAESHGAVALGFVLTGEGDKAQHHLDLADRLDPRNLTARYVRALVAGEISDAASLRKLAVRLLDRPGFFGNKLSDSFTRNSEEPKQSA